MIDMTDISKLLSHENPLSLTIAAPIVTKGPQTRQNPIRLKDHLREADQLLQARGVSAGDIKKILAPIAELAEDSAFLRKASAGLVIFRCPEWTEVVQLPYEVPDKTFLGHRFYTKPLFQMLFNNPTFYLLSLEKHGVELYEMTRYSVERLEPKGLVATYEEAIRLDDPSRTLQMHGAQNGSSNGAVLHGQGAGETHEEGYLRQFCGTVAKTVDAELARRGGNHPLIIAAPPKLNTFYHEVSRYNGLSAEHLTECSNGFSPEQKQARALEIIDKIRMEEEKSSLEKAAELLAKDRAVSDIEQAAIAAREGRVDFAIVATDQERWGEAQPEFIGAVATGTNGAPMVDFVDEIAVGTHLHGGRVLLRPMQDIPGNIPAVAALRF